MGRDAMSTTGVSATTSEPPSVTTTRSSGWAVAATSAGAATARPAPSIAVPEAAARTCRARSHRGPGARSSPRADPEPFLDEPVLQLGEQHAGG